jgi:WD40 repeat protein
METKTESIEANPNLNFYFGSYEGKLFSVDVDLKKKKISSSMAFKVSENSIKVITKKDSHVFASGVDEIIHIFDMIKKEDKGTVVTYSGSISNLRIIKNFLFASGDEPNISIWRMSDFNLVHTLKGHKAPVICFEVHKSAKFGVSAARDSTMIVWNLVTGIKILKYNFKNCLVCNKILFVKNESLAVLIFDGEFWIFDMFKNSENYEDLIIKKVKISHKIFEAFVFKSGLYLIHSNGDLTIFSEFLEKDDKREISLEKPQKLSDDDLDIRVKLSNICYSSKIKLLNIVYTNNLTYLYDLNKINKLLPDLSAKQEFKKYMIIDLKTSDRITCVNSSLINS